MKKSRLFLAPKHWSLQAQVMSSVSLFFMLALSSIFYFSSGYFEQELVRSLLEQQRTLASASAQLIDRKVLLYRHLLTEEASHIKPSQTSFAGLNLTLSHSALNLVFDGGLLAVAIRPPEIPHTNLRKNGLQDTPISLPTDQHLITRLTHNPQPRPIQSFDASIMPLTSSAITTHFISSSQAKPDASTHDLALYFHALLGDRIPFEFSQSALDPKPFDPQNFYTKDPLDFATQKNSSGLKTPKDVLDPVKSVEHGKIESTESDPIALHSPLTLSSLHLLGFSTPTGTDSTRFESHIPSFFSSSLTLIEDAPDLVSLQSGQFLEPYWAQPTTGVIYLVAPIPDPDFPNAYLQGAILLNQRGFFASLYPTLQILDSTEKAFLEITDTRHQFLMNAKDPQKINTIGIFSEAENALRQQALNHHAPVGILNYQQGQVIKAFARVPSTGWIIGVSSSLEASIIPFKIARWSFFSLSVFLFFLLVYALSLTLSRLTSPLDHLSLWAKKSIDDTLPPLPFYSGCMESKKLGSALKSLRQRILTEKEQSQEAYLELEDRVSERSVELKAALTALETAQANDTKREKLASMGTLVAGVAHELNTPIGNALMAANILKEDALKISTSISEGRANKTLLTSIESSLKEGARSVEASMLRASSIIKNFKQVSIEGQQETRVRFNLALTLKDVVQAAAPTLQKGQFSISIQSPDTVWVEGYPSSIHHILSNLIANSMLHGFDGRSNGKMLLQVQLKDQFVLLTYEDNGLGMSPQIMSQIFDPFFTTKQGRGGYGLGLHLVHQMVTEQLGGHIQVHSILHQGTVFTLTLPLKMIKPSLGSLSVPHTDSTEWVPPAPATESFIAATKSLQTHDSHIPPNIHPLTPSETAALLSKMEKSPSQEMTPHPSSSGGTDA